MVAVIVFILIAGFILGGMLNSAQSDEAKSKREAIQNKKDVQIKAYSEIIQKIKIPDNCLRVNYMLGTKMLIGSNLVWRKDESIYFFPTPGCIDWYFSTGGMPLYNFDPLKIKTQNLKFEQLKFDVFQISIKDIVKFEKEGEVFRENKISGGGGGGSSIGRAIVGGVVAGGAGAIVASRKETEAIKSELITHDDRTCRLTYMENNIKQIMLFDYLDYKTFKELIPEKDISVIDEIRRRNVIDEHTSPQTDNIQKIRDLGTLRDEGILTQEEFEEKKKELLKKV